jgi:hypothetical protein
MPEPEMTNADEPPPRRTAFEWSLAALRPADSGAERPSFLFKAGQASRERAVRFWRWVAVGSLALLAGVTAGGFALVMHLRHRAEVAEARAGSPLPAPASRDRQEAGGIEAPHHVEGEKQEDRTPPSDSVGAPLVGARFEGHPQGVPLQASPAEVAAARRTRRDILTAGLGVIPDATPAPPPTELERKLNTPPTVLTIPRVTPKKPAPIVPEEDPSPDPDIRR